MPIYTFALPEAGSPTPFTPVPGVANWILESTTSQPPAGQRRLISAAFYSEESESNGTQRTRIARDTTVGLGARTAITYSRLDMTDEPAASVYGTYLSSAYGTTPPTIVNGALFCRAWPVGGRVVWNAPPGGGFTLYGVASLECRQDVGAFKASFRGAWEE